MFTDLAFIVMIVIHELVHVIYC